MAAGTVEQMDAELDRKTPNRPERILIADDEHMVAIGLRSHLVELGYAVVGPASDGVDAIDLARTHRPDMALLDIRMPGKDGIESGEVISRQLGIPVVFISAFSDREYLESCTQFPTYGYLLKPISRDELRVTIEVAWSRFRDACGQQEQIDRLKSRLDDRKIIEQAKWVLVQKKQMTEPDAMRMLQRQARNNRRTLVDVARSLIEHENLFADE